MLDSFTRMTLHRVWFRNDIPKDKESLLFKREGGFSHSLDKGHLRRLPFGIYLLRILAQIMRTPSLKCYYDENFCFRFRVFLT